MKTQILRSGDGYIAMAIFDYDRSEAELKKIVEAAPSLVSFIEAFPTTRLRELVVQAETILRALSK